MEVKILRVVKRLGEVYPDLGKYEISFHTDSNMGEAFYDRPVETHEDIGGFLVRFTDKSTIHLPLEAVLSSDDPRLIEKWGEKIIATRRAS